MFRIFIILIAAFLASIVYLTVDIYIASSTTTDESADAAVVLGAAVWGKQPSPVFRERINHAIQLYNAGRIKHIIFTGGLAQGDQLAEAEAAREYALAMEVPLAAILIETRSHNTCENLLEARQLMHTHGIERVIVVSDPMHMRRAMWLAEVLEIKALPSPTPSSRYLSTGSKAAFLVHEVYYSIPRLVGYHRCG